MTDENLDTDPPETTGKLGRRGLLGYLTAASAGAVLGGTAVGAAAATQLGQTPTPTPAGQTYSPLGKHQSGIVTAQPSLMHAVAFRLLPGATTQTLGRWMRTWTADIEALMAGRPVPGDPAGELAQAGVNMTVTVGFGPAVFAVKGLERSKPTGFIDIPAMTHDQLQPRWSGGDVLAIISATDQTSVAYAQDRLTRDAAPFAELAWVQTGSWRGTNAQGTAVTGRNLFGQVDGTGNPTGDQLSQTLWPTDPPAWFDGGTCLVVRRIEMQLDGWNKITRSQQESSVGRHLSTGAPLGKTAEFDSPDFSATHSSGVPVIPENAHVRRAHPDFNAGRSMLRRSWNYHDVTPDKAPPQVSVGLVFMAYVANIAREFVPVQASLDASDALNEWTTAIGSAVFALPPGWEKGGWIGSGLLS